MLFRYHQVETILAKYRVVRPGALGSLKGRLIHLRRVGLGAASPGTGKRIDYSYEDVARWAFCLELADFGIAPIEIAQIVPEVWREVRRVFLRELGPEQRFFVAQAELVAQSERDRARPPLTPGISPVLAYEDRYVLASNEVVPDVLERALVINLSNVARVLDVAVEIVVTAPVRR